MIVRNLRFVLVCVLPLTLTIVSCKKSGTDTKRESLTGSAVVTTESGPPLQGQSDQACIDTDPIGDGWGWDGTGSCKIGVGELSDVEQAGDDNSQSNEAVPFSILDNCYKLQSGQYHITELVTDVILTAGQSNAAGENTQYQPDTIYEDRLNDRVLVWTENGKWEMADPATQTWHNGKFPSGKGKSHNHPAFQIGRAIAEQDECRVVGIIATAASGMEIDHWRYDREGHFTEIRNTATNAINALPTRHQIDMIWWMQGEADNDPFIGRYFSKLNELIGMFRSEAWFSTDGYFLANETGWFPYANEAIRMLRTDGDELTDYSRGEDSVADSFPSLTEFDVAVHFNEIALRKIGYIVADKYLYEHLSE